MDCAGRHYAWFQNTQCEYFPCHKGVDPAAFNCLFCYCPLYRASDCGGAFVLRPNGIKDCSRCTVPHNGIESYDTILSRLRKAHFSGGNP